MPLQWLPLQQRQQQGQMPQQRSPISQALKPQQRQFLGTMDTSNRFVDEQKAKWAEEDKLKKQERDEQTNKAQELGMRMGKAIQGQQQGAMAQAEQKAVANKQIESNPEPAAKEMYELLKTLPDEAKSQLLNQIFTPTAPSGKITSAGKQVTMPEKYNPIAQIFINKGWAMFDAKGNVNLSEPEREFEKGTFEIVEKGGRVYKFNTATNEEILLGSADEPETVIAEINKDANTQALAIAKASAGTKDVITFTEAKFDVLKDSYGMNDEEAADLSKIKEMPKGDKGKSLIKTFTDWLTGKKETSPETLGAPMKSLGKPTFDEAKANTLVDVISDDVTTAERAHFKSQGATDADIDEAINRKGSK